MKGWNEMGYDTIHETDLVSIIGTLAGTFDGIADKVGKFDAPRKHDSSVGRYGSLTQATKGLTLEFPVLISKANKIDSAAIVAKAYEAKFVTMLHLALAACSITNASDAINYIKNFHTNLDSKMSVDDFISAMDSISESNITADIYAKMRAVQEDIKNLNYFFEDNINESSLTQYKVFKEGGNLRVIKELKSPEELMNDIEKNTNDNTDRTNLAKLKMQASKDKKNDQYQDNRDQRDKVNANNTIIKNTLLSNEVKKANELTPTMMIVNCITKDNTKLQFVIGVKAKLYEVEPADVINKIITKHVDNNVLLKLVKVSTREISFVKDFLLAIDSAKLDALSRSKRGSANKLFKVLERRAINGKIRKTLKTNNYYKAITSLVISQEEVEELKKNNIDVMNAKIIRPIMEKLNLISFAVIDETSDAVRFIFDTGDDVYEIIPFDKLEREQKDGMSRKVINLMAKMN